MHIDFLRLLFLVGVICPLMQERSLWLKKLISQEPEDAMFNIRRPVYKRLFKSNHMLPADQKKQCKSNLSSVSVLTNGSLHQDLMHSRCHGTTVPNVCLQALTLCLLSARDFFHPFPKQRACSQAKVTPKVTKSNFLPNDITLLRDKRENALIFYQILSTYSLRKCMENSLENLYVKIET